MKAENAADVKVANNSGIYTDSKGFAVVPYVAPYRQNSLTLNTDRLNNNTDVLNDTQTVVPTKGALTLADFPTVTGYRILLQLTGKTIPFGATATINHRDNTPEGIVDDRHQIAQASDKTHNVTAECR